MALTRRAALAALMTAPLARPASAQSTPIPVVASFSILADMIHRIGEDRVAIRALAGPNQDLHGFEPRPSDLQAVAQARLLVTNGLGLEGWADRIAKAAGFKGIAVVATTGVKPLKTAHSHAHNHSHAHGAFDPHAWQSIANAKLYVANIRNGLAKADPAHAAAYTAAAARYTAELDALDAEIRALLAPIPRPRRRVVTSHEAFAYFAASYGVDMLAVAGTWRNAEPSARELAALSAQVKRQNIRALFLENAGTGTALRALATEANVAIGGRLYADALSEPDGPAPNYIAMMRHNATRIAEALK
jgi:zinc/manganese transport system substrate-binding protein